MNARKLNSEAGAVALESPHLELVREDEARQDRPWAEAALAGEKRVLEMITGGHSLSAILNALCLLVEGTCRGSLCSVLLLDAKGERLRQGAAPASRIATSRPSMVMKSLPAGDLAGRLLSARSK